MYISKEYAKAMKLHNDPNNHLIIEMKPCPDDPQDPITEDDLYKEYGTGNTYAMSTFGRAMDAESFLYVLQKEIEEGNIKLEIIPKKNFDLGYIKKLIESFMKEKD